MNVHTDITASFTAIAAAFAALPCFTEVTDLCDTDTPAPFFTAYITHPERGEGEFLCTFHHPDTDSDYTELSLEVHFDDEYSSTELTLLGADINVPEMLLIAYGERSIAA